MPDKECLDILARARELNNQTKQLVAFIGRLGEELTGLKNFCEGRDCSECPVGQVRRGVVGVALNPRETVVSAVTTAIELIVSSGGDNVVEELSSDQDS